MKGAILIPEYGHYSALLINYNNYDEKYKNLEMGKNYYYDEYKNIYIYHINSEWKSIFSNFIPYYLFYIKKNN